MLASGFTQTQRQIRLWAADLSAFGINPSNIGNIAYFKITLSGDCDVAFVAYNTTSISVSQVLDLQVENGGCLTRRSVKDEKKDFSAYPNPATSYVNITHAAAKGDEKILVFNMLG